jgi:hypothetical protein
MIVRLQTIIAGCAAAALVTLGANAASAIPASGPAAPEKTPVAHPVTVPTAAPAAAPEYVVVQGGLSFATFRTAQGLPAPGALSGPANVVLGGSASAYSKDTITKWELEARTPVPRDFEIGVRTSTGLATATYMCVRGLLNRAEKSPDGTLVSVSITCPNLSLKAHGK